MLGNLCAAMRATFVVSVRGRFAGLATRVFAAGILLMCAQAAFAQQVQVNKSFTPASVGLGATTVVTVTLQNNSTTSAATITGFQDDIASMAGFGILLSSPAPTTTCSGGTPSVVGSAVVMNNGVIPIAPNTFTPGSCTITFSVRANKVGNGFNTIRAADVVTSNGSPSADVTQTLTVQSANIAVASGPTQTVLTGSTATVTYTLTNPTATPITNATFPITSNGASAYTVTGTGGTCAGITASLPPSGTTGTTTFSGVGIPANGSCTVTLLVTTTSVETVNFALAANGISDDQAATNSAGVSAQAKFVNGQPTVTKGFNPTSAQPGGNSLVTLKIQNVLTDQALTGLTDFDNLPAGLTVDGTFTPTQTGCGSAAFTGSGTGTFTISNATIAANTTCTVTFRVVVSATQPPGNLVNTVQKGNLTATTSVTNSPITQAAADTSATLLVTAAGGNVTATKVANPTSAGLNSPVQITLTFTSQGSAAFTGGTFNDPLPQSPVRMLQFVDATHSTTVSAGCGGSSNITAVNGAAIVSGSGLAVPSNGTCVVTFFVYFPDVTGVSRLDQNVLTGGATFTGTAGNVTTNAPSANITELPTITATNYVASASGLTNQPLTVAATVNVPAGVSDTNATLGVTLTPGKVALAATPNFTFSAGCPAGLDASAITIAANRESFTVALGNISQSCTIGYDVIDEGGAAGTFTPSNPTYSGALTGNTPVASTATNNVTFTAPQPIGVSKAFIPNQIQAGGTSTAQINLVVPKAGTLPVTEAEGVAFTDNLPANLVFSPTPNVGFTGCQQAGQPAPGFTITGTSISFTNISLITVGSVQTTCTISFDVTSNVVGAPLNQIPVGAVTSAAGGGASNTQTAKASLTVAAGLGVQKTFVSPSFPIGSTDYIRLLITNTATPSNLTGGSLVDNMPAFLVLASTTEGPAQLGDPPQCGGTIAGTVGSSSYTLNGLAVGGYIGGVAGQCVVYVLVQASPAAVPGAVTNTIATGGLNIGGFGNQNPASGTVTLTAAPAVAVTKSFAPSTIAPNGTSTLTVTVANTSANSSALTGLALTDTLPGGVLVAATPSTATTCGGTATATAGGSTLALSGGSLAANASCTISVSVTASTAGTYTNTIPTGSVTTDQGASNTTAATADLLVAPPVAIAKAFLPTSVTVGGQSVLTITIANNAAGSVALSGMALTDNLPSGVAVAATPNASTTCGAGTVTAVPAASAVSLGNGSVAAGASCTITLTVTASSAGTFTNTIPAGALTDTLGVSNATPAVATLAATAPVAISKAFSPTSIASGATSTLTITIPNTDAGAVALSGMALTDTLPGNVTIASTPNASTTCGAGTVAATAGGSTVALSNASLAAGASCTITVSVTATATGTYTNTIPANALSDAQNVTNTAPTTADLTVTAPLGITKAFSPTSITTGGTSTLTITIPNTDAGAVALSGMALTDTLPSGITIAATPNASTTCGSGTATATGGGTTVALSNGTLAANATCTIVVSVTGTTTGTFTNTIPADALTDTQNVTNTAPTTADLTITAPSSIAKSFSPATFTTGSTSTLTITIPNTAVGAVDLTNMALTDNLPSGLTVAATPNASTTCGGTISATPGATSVLLSGGSLAANATCTIVASVTAAATGSYVNTIPAGALTDTQGVTNTAVATATVSVTQRPSTDLTAVPMPRWLLIVLAAALIGVTYLQRRSRNGK